MEGKKEKKIDEIQCGKEGDLHEETTKQRLINPFISGLTPALFLEVEDSWVEEIHKHIIAQNGQQFAFAKCGYSEFYFYSEHKQNSEQGISGFVFSLSLRNKKQWEVRQGWNLFV